MYKKAFLCLKSVTKLAALHLSTLPSQIQGDFETLTENLELNLKHFVQRNPLLIVATGDFSAK